MRAALQAAYGGGAGCFIYFSSCGLYGDEPDDDTWVDEDTPTRRDAAMQNVLERRARDRGELVRPAAHRHACGSRRCMARAAASASACARALRDPRGRPARDVAHPHRRCRALVFAAEERAPAKVVYLVGDDEPMTQGDYARWLSERLGVGMPPSRQMVEAGKGRASRTATAGSATRA